MFRQVNKKLRYTKTLEGNEIINIQVNGSNRTFTILERLGYKSEEAILAEQRKKERIENLKTWLEKKKQNESNT